MRCRPSVIVCLSGLTGVATTAAVPGSPLLPPLPPGSAPWGPFRALADLIGLGAASSETLLIVASLAVVTAVIGFLWVLRDAWAGEISVRTILALAVIAHIAVLALPLLYSRDVYAYAMYGRIASLHHGNPYVLRPIDVSSDPLFTLMGSDWARSTSVYGPAFSALSWGVTRGVRSVDAIVWTYRLIAVAASLATVVIVAVTSSRLRPERAAFAVAAVGLNPAVLFLVVGGGHNDALVGLAIAGAFALVVAKRWLWAVALLTLGTMVKAPAVVPLVMLVSADLAARPRMQRRGRAAAIAGVMGGIVLTTAMPFLQASDPTLGQAQLVDHEGWLAPGRWVRVVAETLGTRIAPSVGSVMSLGARLAFALALIAAVALIARATARRAAMGTLPPVAMGSAWAWGLSVFLVMVPVFVPWYVAWVLPLAWLLPRAPRRFLIAVSMLQTLSLIAADGELFPVVHQDQAMIAYYVLAPLVLLLAVVPARDLIRRLRRGSPLEAASRPGVEVLGQRVALPS